MSALPRPDLPPGPHHDLVDALHDLHHRAGWPSLRALAREVGVSHTTVSKVFSSLAVPAWGTVELLVEAMAGDVAEIRVLWLAASAPATGVPAATRRIAGRRTELAAVRRHLETGSGLLLVSGEAGMGKTTLVAAAASSAATFVAAGHCLPLSTEVPLLPMVDVLQRMQDAEQGRWLEEALSDCPAYTRGSIARLLPDITAPAKDPDDDARQRLLLALRALLRAFRSRRPLALLLEDLHWADASTLDVLEHLLATDVTVPLVATWRTDDDSTPEPLLAWRARVTRLPSTTELRLQPLSKEETGDQIALATGHEPDPELLDRIHSRSRGHPLFTDQLAAQHTDDGSLPSLLADLFRQRLTGLSRPATTIVRVLGVATRPLESTVLGRATRMAADQLGTGLDELRDRRLLAASNGRRDLALRHPLLAEAVANELVGGQAVDVHRSLAGALERSENPEAAEIAAHWELAGERDRELAWRARAARAAASRFAPQQAADQWLRVLTLWPDADEQTGTPPVRRCDAYVGAIEALSSAGDTKRADSIATDALATLDRLAAEDAARILRWAADCAFLVSGPERALGLLDRAIALHETLPASADFARALERRAGQLRALGRYAESAAAVTSAVAIAERVDDPGLLRGMIAILAWHEQMSGDSASAMAHARDALDIRVDHADPQGDIRVSVCVTDLLLWAEADAREIQEAGRRGLQAVADWDIAAYSSALLLSNVADGWIRAGHVGRAAELVDPQTSGPVTLDSWSVHVSRALVDTRRGDLEAARARYDQLAPEDVQHLANRSELVLAMGELDLWLDHPQDQLDRALPLLEEAAPTDASEFMGLLLVQAARATADLGPARSEGPADRLRDLHARLLTDPFASTAVPANRTAGGATWVAELARADHTEDAGVWARAANEWDHLTRPHDSAYCRWRAAQVALRDGHGTVAARLLKRAATDAREHVPLGRAIATTAAGAR